MKHLATLFLAFVLLAMPSGAGTDPTAASASEVREAVNLAIVAWAAHPIDPLAANCVGAGDPAPCCTAAGVGASCLPCGGGDCCNAPATTAECLAYARDYVIPALSSPPHFGGISFRVEAQCEDDGDWICNPQYPSGSPGATPAGTLPGASVVADDVASWLSNLAAQQILP